MYSCRKPPGRERFPAREFKEMSGPPKSCWQRMELTNVGSPKGREPYGDRVPVVVAGATTCQGGREGRPQGEGAQVTDINEPERHAKCRAPRRCWVSSANEAGVQQPCSELYRQMFNPSLYLLAYGKIYANQ